MCCVSSSAMGRLAMWTWVLFFSPVLLIQSCWSHPRSRALPWCRGVCWSGVTGWILILFIFMITEFRWSDMSDLVIKYSKVEDDAEYEAYYAYILSDLRQAGLCALLSCTRWAAWILPRGWNCIAIISVKRVLGTHWYRGLLFAIICLIKLMFLSLSMLC